MRLTLGVNNCFAVKRWPRPDEWTQIVREELDLEVVQHSLDLSDPSRDGESDAQGVRDACTARGIRIDSVFTGLIAYSANMMLDPEPAQRDRAEAYWADAIRLSSRLGASSFGGHTGSLSRRDADTPARRQHLWEELHGRLSRLAKLARAHGLEALLVENMACDREPCRMADIESLMSSGDDTHAALTLCLDVGHQCVPGTAGDEADPYAWLVRLGRQASMIHLQQSDAGSDHHWPFTEEYNRRGRVHAGPVLRALADSGARAATLMLEVIPAFEADDATVLDELRASVAYWKQALAAFGEA